jgi:hypothetical protein
MTAIVGVLNSRAFAIAADSAITVTGSNGKKVYNRSNKIFTLSKLHPIGIAIYSSADYLGIPLETIIKLYRQRLKEKSYGTVEAYKNDFLSFLTKLIPGVGTEVKRDSFYLFCGHYYHPLVKALTDKISEFNHLGLDAAAIDLQYDEMVHEAILVQKAEADKLIKANYIQKSFEEFIAFHNEQLTAIFNYINDKIKELNPIYLLKQAALDELKQLFYQMINIEWIFETYSGLVFFGFGEDEMYPITDEILIGTAICDIPRIRQMRVAKIIPGQSNANIIPYAQADVTHTVLTGVDPKYIDTMTTSIKSSFQDVANGVAPLLADQAQAPAVTDFINNIGQQLTQKLNDFQSSAITGPLLDVLAYMGKEDMAELAESLVNITSIKRKFTSSDSGDESVGGPVDVAIVTKGDGFIWLKRKHYFDIGNNPGYNEKYLKF